MPLISGVDVATLVKNLDRRQALLWHACQLRDLAAYVAVGGVPSRAYLTETGNVFTAFETDEIDVTNHVWDKVFFNFSDFGNCFASGFDCVPNCYGPIVLAFRPKVIASAQDISITLRSASATGFDRVSEGLSVDEAELIFQKDKKWLLWAEELEAIFNRDVRIPEMNCAVPTGFAPFSEIAFTVVDPYLIDGETLADVARRVLAALPRPPRVFIRECRNKRRVEDYIDLWNAVAAGARGVEEIPPLLPPGSGLANWITKARQTESVVYQCPRYAEYLSEGTINAAGQF